MGSVSKQEQQTNTLLGLFTHKLSGQASLCLAESIIDQIQDTKKIDYSPAAAAYLFLWAKIP